MMDTEILAQQTGKKIAEKLNENVVSLSDFWANSTPVRHCFLDQLLPDAAASQFASMLPDPNNMMYRNTVKERKRVGIKLEEYEPEMSVILYAFQQPEVVEAIEQITGLKQMQADASLYGSGISMMMKDDFLLPHLDNSHDGDGNLYRVLNLLYYVTPDWPEHAGGNLELWSRDMKERVEVHSKFNRLVLMETHTDSLHSVSKVIKEGTRACISNYYFSEVPANNESHVHKTTFFARPEDGAGKKLKLGIEGFAKRVLSGIFPNKGGNTKHRRDG